VCVYQFHHLSIKTGEGRIRGLGRKLSSIEIGFDAPEPIRNPPAVVPP